MKPKPQTPRVVHRDLIAKWQSVGFYFPDGHIEIDPRQKSSDYLDTLIHEHLHFCFPKLREGRVTWAAGVIAKAIWKARYRKVEK